MTIGYKGRQVEEQYRKLTKDPDNPKEQEIKDAKFVLKIECWHVCLSAEQTRK